MTSHLFAIFLFVFPAENFKMDKIIRKVIT